MNDKEVLSMTSIQRLERSGFSLQVVIFPVAEYHGVIG